MNRILVAVDGSEQSIKAVEWAAKVADLTGAGLTLMNVFKLSKAEAAELAHLNNEQMIEKMYAHGESHFEKAVGVIPEGLTYDTKVVMGQPGDEILDAAEYDGYDHIVMGSRGLSVLEEIFLGSVSEKVIRNAHCAVTIIR